jgi:hypothetical protein
VLSRRQLNLIFDREGDVLMPRGVARSAEEALIVIADKDRQLFEPEEHRP